MYRPHVQEAEIEIDPAQLENFKIAITAQIEAAIRVEPGVVALYAVCEVDNPVHGQGFRNLPGFRCVQVSSRDRAFQAIQGNDREDDQIAQARPSDADYAWCQGKMTKP
jgi:hypothetical protein